MSSFSKLNYYCNAVITFEVDLHLFRSLSERLLGGCQFDYLVLHELEICFRLRSFLLYSCFNVGGD
jgi:hypothetical protein